MPATTLNGLRARAKGAKPLAVLCNDLHLRATRPVARAEADWLGLQAEALTELRALAEALEVSVVCAGDIFDRPTPPPEIIRLAVERMPPCWAIPGQHDLPAHDLGQVGRSAYGVLVAACKVWTLPTDVFTKASRHLGLVGYPWGQVPRPLECDDTGGRCVVAVCHQYVAPSKAKAYPGAPPKAIMGGQWADQLAGYHVAHFGDNHQGFTTTVGGCVVWNGGGFLATKADEKEYLPRVGVLFEGPVVVPYSLPTQRRAEWAPVVGMLADAQAQVETSAQAFLQTLAQVAAVGSDYVEALRVAAEGQPDAVAQVLRGCLSEVRGDV
jgi:hypothetical protein